MCDEIIKKTKAFQQKIIQKRITEQRTENEKLLT